MTWLLIFAVLVVALVAGAVLPRRARYLDGQDRDGDRGAGFPWFWLVFPLTALLTALAVGAWLPGAGISAGGDFGWTMYAPLGDAVHESEWDSVRNDYLSDDQAWSLLFFGDVGRFVYPAVAALGIVLTALAWRRRRI
ncbi:MAG: amino acid permease [Mycobacteriaceae bacterium]|uniref:amino acid permease n=1 Tax=Corynebacterium sp. TaxID=1720 RepID=UPI003F9AB38B